LAERPKIDLGLTGYDELFMTDAEQQQNKLPRIHDIPLELIDDFPGHPFQVRMDEDMQQLVDSIKERGVLAPITLREKDDGRYELVSGHRRKMACELAGLPTVRAEIRDMTSDEAIIFMVESNFQRSQILPSEKAFSYKMRLEAMNRQGKRTDLTCFVSWCANECGYIDIGVIPKFAGCVNGVNWFKTRGQWADGSFEPAPGMIIFFDWDSPNGESGPQDGLSDHVGIVEKVENGRVYTIEGNTSDSCARRSYPLGYYEILGYGIPAY